MVFLMSDIIQTMSDIAFAKCGLVKSSPYLPEFSWEETAVFVGEK